MCAGSSTHTWPRRVPGITLKTPPVRRQMDRKLGVAQRHPLEPWLIWVLRETGALLHLSRGYGVAVAITLGIVYHLFMMTNFYHSPTFAS